MRRRKWFAAIVALSLVPLGTWAYFRKPDFASLDPTDVHSVEVKFARWGEDGAAPGATSEDRDAIAAVLIAIRSAEKTQDHKCGSRGVIVLHQSLRQPTRLEFLPGHHAEWYEFRYAGNAYRVPRAEFVAAMRRVGVEVPLECQ